MGTRHTSLYVSLSLVLFPLDTGWSQGIFEGGRQFQQGPIYEGAHQFCYNCQWINPCPLPLFCSLLPAGKSSLMKILAGVDTNFEGRVQLSPGIRIGFLEQEPELKDGERCGGGVGNEGDGVCDQV